MPFEPWRSFPLRHVRQIASIFVLLLLLVTAPFAGGYLLGHADAFEPGQTPLESVLARGRE